MATPIQTFTPIHSWVASSNVGSVSFGSIDQGYDHLVITGGFSRSINGDFGGRGAEFQWNGITSGYKQLGGYVGQSSSTAQLQYAASAAASVAMPAGNYNYQGGRQAFELWITDYKNTSWYKHIFGKYTNNDTAANNGGTIWIQSGLIPTTGALTSLYIYEQVDTFVTGDWVTIYGVKNA